MAVEGAMTVGLFGFVLILEFVFIFYIFLVVTLLDPIFLIFSIFPPCSKLPSPPCTPSSYSYYNSDKGLTNLEDSLSKYTLFI